MDVCVDSWALSTWLDYFGLDEKFLKPLGIVTWRTVFYRWFNDVGGMVAIFEASHIKVRCQVRSLIWKRFGFGGFGMECAQKCASGVGM